MNHILDGDNRHLIIELQIEVQGKDLVCPGIAVERPMGGGGVVVEGELQYFKAVVWLLKKIGQIREFIGGECMS